MEDEMIIALCQAGDLQAFRQLVERYQNEALGHALFFLRQREDAEDAVQEAFVKAWAGLERFEKGRKFYPWFYTILRHCCLKLAARRPKTADAGQVEKVALLRCAEEDHASAERMQVLENALFKLSFEEREIITLKHFDGLSYAELAERLRIPIGTVMSRLYNARKHLRESINRATQENDECRM